MLSWLYGKQKTQTAYDLEKEKRRTLAVEVALRCVEQKRTEILAKCPDCSVNIFHDEYRTELVAYDKTGNTQVARELHLHS